MKLSCDVINDLLPLYHDEVCSEESKRIVEEHLKECENCREIAKKIGGEFHVPQKELDDATFFKNIQQEYKIKNIVFSILLICLVGIGSHLARNYQFMPVGASSFQISEVSQLEDKTIGFYMKICDGKDVRFITAKRANEEGIVFVDEIKGVELSDTEFLKWKLESQWDEGIFIRQKTYMEHITHDGLELIDPYYNVKCAGMPERCKNLFISAMTQVPIETKNKDEEEFISHELTMDDFKEGLVIPSKLLPRRIKGGVVLVDTTYEIR